MLDIIIPIFNEEKVLIEKSQYFFWLSTQANLIFVDGQSTDNSMNIAKDYGNVILSRRGRGVQKNKGVSESKTENLLFLHIDCEITKKELQKIEDVLNQGAKVGCLTLKIDDKNIFFRLCEIITNNLLKKFGLTDGDLGLFIQKKILIDLGYFDRVKYLEDLMIGKKIKENGIPLMILKEKIKVSSRSWRETGFLKLMLKYCKMYIQYICKRYPYIKE